LVSAPTDAAPDRLAVGPGVRRARQHRVLGRDPAQPAVLAPARNPDARPSRCAFARRATRTLARAAPSTRVRPNSTRTEPAAWSSQPRVIVIGRSSSAARPSARVRPETLSSRSRPPAFVRTLGFVRLALAWHPYRGSDECGC